MGRNHVRVYSEQKEVGTTYIYDLNADTAGEVAAATGAEVCRSMEELLRKAECVSVCVPAPYRFTAIEQVLAAGVHLLIEKPLCLTSRECEEVLKRIPEGLTVTGNLSSVIRVPTCSVKQDPIRTWCLAWSDLQGKGVTSTGVVKRLINLLRQAVLF